MKHTGKMKHLHNEIEPTNKWIEEAFEKIEKDRRGDILDLMLSHALANDQGRTTNDAFKPSA